MRKLFYNFPLTDHHGWGVYGSNLLLQGYKNANFKPIPINWPPSFLYPVDPITHNILKANEASWGNGLSAEDGDLMLSAFGNEVIKQDVSKKMVEVGVTFFEQNPLPVSEIKKLKTFNAIIVGSSWNKNSLSSMGIDSQLVIQGIDTDLFRPQAKRYLIDKFVVFSGGKLEFRKGQDILLKAFSLFAKTRPDALLITAWRSPWEKSIATSLNQSEVCYPIVSEDNFSKSLSNWILKNGVHQNQFLNMEAISNRLMPDVFREVDLAVFPNRCEGGTNLVAMEALSSGILCAISNNTGHQDIIKNNNCIVLKEQKSVKGSDHYQDWGESSVDEIVAVLESAYKNRGPKQNDSIRDSVTDFSWKNSINNLLQILNQYK
ncbi:glycosyltransferase family 4 protein [Polynucleobacter paneuropaeus]|jgi:glycosyltransferase involved in cell wall biosynthesis|nr:glycosyltransferase family 4 protein [Polynucleobacter paneuropaeus]MBT8573331.1 glycosyltransferase family 4 protein [Polynucleobacter paneuropaeus]QWD21225.1 glycosyltransferase family 4 protein [Polynucleobacter paneuropaeus]